MSADMRPADYDVDLIAGDDWTLVITAVDDAGDAVDLSAATITADILSKGATRSVTDTITDAVSGAGDNVITLSLTDTETAASILTDPIHHLWSLTVTISGDTRQWLAGEFNVWPRGDSRAVSSSGTAVTATVDNTVTLTVVAAGGIPDTASTVGITDSASYFTGTDVEAALAEIRQGHRFGSGAPEGVVTATVGSRYYDTAVTVGVSVWRKETGSGNTGWVVAEADSGSRKVLSWTSGTQDGSNQVGTIDTAYYQLNGTGDLRVRRIGDRVFMWSVQAAANTIETLGTTKQQLLTTNVWPSGFRLSPARTAGGSYNGADQLVIFDSASTTANLGIRTIGSAVALDRVSVEWITGDSWPSSLPGVAV